MRELFIYFKARCEHENAVVHQVQAMHESLCQAHPGLQARLLRRPEDLRTLEPDGLHTWMEVYSHPPNRGPAPAHLPAQGIDARLEAAIAEAAKSLEPWIVGQRHVEAFVAWPAPAQRCAAPPRL